jgi:hypothetical protein
MQSDNRQTAVEQAPILVPLSWAGNRLIPELSPDVASEPNRELTILHTNDFHSSVDGRPNAHGQVSGGLARIATTIRHWMLVILSLAKARGGTLRELVLLHNCVASRAAIWLPLAIMTWNTG